MGKIMALAIVLMFAGTSSSWAVFGLEDLSFDGSLEYNADSADNELDLSPANDHRGGVNTRVRVGVNATVTENVAGRVEFTRIGRQYGTGPTTIATEEGLWNIQNAFIDITELPWISRLRVGRQYVGEQGDLVWNIGPRDDDSLSVSAVDGALLEGTYFENLMLQVFSGKAFEDDGLVNTDADDGAGDVNVANVEAQIQNLLPGGRVRLGWTAGSDSQTVARNDDIKLQIWRLGVDGGLSDDFLTYRAQYLMNMGELETGGSSVDYAGNAIDLGVGVNFRETTLGGFGLAANFVRGSGDDDTTDSDDDSFRDLSALGVAASDRLFGEIFGKSNTLGGGTPIGQGLDQGAQSGGLQVIHLGGSWSPAFAAQTWLALDFFQFSRSEDSRNGTDIGDDYGTELDLTLGYNYSENVLIEGGYAMFSPDDALAIDKGVATSNDETITKWFLNGKVKWGGQSL